MLRIAAPLTPGECLRYLRILGVPERAPGLAALTELVTAHLRRVPFENVSKLLYYRRRGQGALPDLDAFLEGIERFHLGGTCYPISFHLNRLLVSLGYDAALCGADMDDPDVHLVSVVTVEGREYLVDAGYGGPFSAPMPLDLTQEQELVLGRERYVLRPRDPQGRSRLELHCGGARRHGYLVTPRPRDISEFAQAIESSFSPKATFMNALTIVRFFPERAVALRNLTLVESEGPAYRVRRLPDVGRLPEAISENFGVPAALAREALEGLSLSRQPWGREGAGVGDAPEGGGES